MQVETIAVPTLGNRSYLVHDGAVAVVVDPPRHQRSLGAVEAAAEAAEVEIVAVADTHVHNDYLSGAAVLARRHGADYLLSADEESAERRVGVRAGDRLHYGRLAIDVVAAPGHTPYHQAFWATDGEGPGAVFSGGSLLHGTVGRTDLVDHAATRHLAAAQWRTAHHLAGRHPDAALFPTHGFGSFCSGAPAAATEGGRLRDELAVNPALSGDVNRFVRELVAGFGPVPAYFQQMAGLNRAGAGSRAVEPPRPLDATALSDALLGDAWVVDLRPRADFAAGHLPGSINVEYGDQAATYLGWIVPWGAPLVLLGDPADLERAADDLATIGIEGPGAHRLEPGADLSSSLRRSTWAEFRERAPRDCTVVDVRQRDEWSAGHLPGAVHLPVQDVATAGESLPPGELWVHCRSGYRAGIAASILHRAGRRVVHVDDAWERVGELGLPLAAA